MGTRYVGTPGAIGDFTIRQSVVRLDEAIGRVEDSLSRVVQNDVFQEIDAPGEEGTSLKVNGHLRLRDNKFLYWAPKGVNDVAHRSAGIRWHVKGVSPDRMEFDVGTSTKMVLNANGQVGIGTVTPITTGATMLLDVRGQVAINTTAVHSSGSHVVTIGSQTGKTSLLLLPTDAGGETNIQAWGNTSGSTAIAWGSSRPGAGLTNDAVFSSFSSPTWTERARIVTATGNMLVGSSTDQGGGASGRLQITSGSNQYAMMLMGGSAGTGGPGMQIYKDTTAAVAASIGLFAPADATHTAINDLTFGTLASATWSERMRLVNATGDLLIGTTTDSARLTVTGASDASAIVGTSGTLTTTGRVAFDLASTWSNASGTFTGLRFRATNTNSAVASMLFDFGVGSSSVINAERTGELNIVATPTTSSNGVHLSTTIPSGGTHIGYRWDMTSLSGLSGASVVGTSFDFSALTGTAGVVYGSQINLNTVGLSADTLYGQRILFVPETGTFTNVVVGQNIEWGDNYQGSYGGANTINTMIGLWLHDNDSGDPWGNGTVCTNGIFGALISRPAGGGTWHALCTEGPINLFNNEYIYWGAAATTAIGASTASMRWRTSTSAFEFEIANTAELSLTAAALFPSTNAGLTLGANGNAWSEAWFKDTSAALEHRVLFNSTGIASDLTLTFDLNNGSRNIVLKGDVNTTTYTPTLTNVANAGGTLTAYSTQVMRVGDMVTVSGKLDVTVTAGSTLTQVGISLATGYTSNFGAAEDCAGTAADNTTGHYEAGVIIADATNDRAELQFMPNASTTARTFFFTFTYQTI